MGQEQSSSQNKDISPVGNIVVVKSGNNTSKDQQIVNDPDILKLHNIATFSPLIKASVNGGGIHGVEITNQLDSRPAQTMCARYETHMRLCAEAVAFDQDAITCRLRELDNYSGLVLRGVSERHKMLQGQLNFISTVQDVKRNIDRIEMTLQQIIPLMEKLNEMLPEGERMAPFLKL